MLCLPPCGRIHDIFPHFYFLEEYMMFFHISISWKYINSSTFNVCGRLCLVFHLLHLWKNTWCSSTFLFHESILILPRLMFVESYVKPSTFHICGRIHDIFPHYIFVEAYFSYTFNICGRLCVVFHLPDLWKNRYYVCTFNFCWNIFFFHI